MKEWTEFEKRHLGCSMYNQWRVKSHGGDCTHTSEWVDPKELPAHENRDLNADSKYVKVKAMSTDVAVAFGPSQPEVRVGQRWVSKANGDWYEVKGFAATRETVVVRVGAVDMFVGRAWLLNNCTLQLDATPAKYKAVAAQSTDCYVSFESEVARLTKECSDWKRKAIEDRSNLDAAYERGYQAGSNSRDADVAAQRLSFKEGNLLLRKQSEMADRCSSLTRQLVEQNHALTEAQIRIAQLESFVGPTGMRRFEKLGRKK